MHWCFSKGNKVQNKALTCTIGKKNGYFQKPILQCELDMGTRYDLEGFFHPKMDDNKF